MHRPPFIFVRRQQVLHRVELSEIKFVAAEGNYCYLNLSQDQEFTIKMSLRQLLSQLPEHDFIRIHKSYLINVNHLTRLDMKARVAHISDKELPIGRTYVSDLTKRFLIV